MVKGYYNKVNTYTYKLQNYINANNKNEKAMKTIKVKYNYRKFS